MSGASLEGVAILVANDDYLLAKEACDWLRALGVEICGPVSSECDARRLLAARRVDGAVIKLDLRDGSSAELARTLDRIGIPYACHGTPVPPQRGRLVCSAPMTPYAAISSLLKRIEARQPQGVA